MDRANDFVNDEDTLQALIDPSEEVKKGERKSEQLNKKAKTNRQWRKQERQPDHNSKLIHNNLSVQEEERDKEEWR